MSRRKARENAFLMIFEAAYHENGYYEILLTNTDKEKPEVEYTVECVRGVFEHISEIDAFISDHSIKWKNERISKVSLAILRLALYEMLFGKTVEKVIAINEAVELAKLYSEDESPGFINAILGGIAKTLNGALHHETDGSERNNAE